MSTPSPAAPIEVLVGYDEDADAPVILQRERPGSDEDAWLACGFTKTHERSWWEDHFGPLRDFVPSTAACASQPCPHADDGLRESIRLRRALAEALGMNPPSDPTYAPALSNIVAEAERLAGSDRHGARAVASLIEISNELDAHGFEGSGDLRRRVTAALALAAPRRSGVEGLYETIVSPGVSSIAAERNDQLSRHGFSRAHDDQHVDMELLAAAGCYLSNAVTAEVRNDAASYDKYPTGGPLFWPWREVIDRYPLSDRTELVGWHPSNDPRESLRRAGALIAAELDRLAALAAAGVPLNAEDRETNKLQEDFGAND